MARAIARPHTPFVANEPRVIQMRGRRIPVAAPDDAARLRGDNRRLDALRDELGLVLGNRRENMDRESIGLWEICGDEFNSAFHELCDQGDVAG